MEYECPTFSGSIVTASVKIFRYVEQRSRSRLQGQNFWYERIYLNTRNVHVKYESPTSNGPSYEKCEISRYVGQRSQ